MPRGSKPGERRGGRQRGTPNKKTALKNAAIGAAAANPNLSPLDFLLALMRDPNLDLEVRVTVAEAALPLVHTKPKEPSQKKSVTAKYGTSRNGVNAHNGGVDSSAPNAEAAKAGVPVNQETGNAEVTPLDFLLALMRHADTPPHIRLRAVVVARYVHPKPKSGAEEESPADEYRLPENPRDHPLWEAMQPIFRIVEAHEAEKAAAEARRARPRAPHEP